MIHVWARRPWPGALWHLVGATVGRHVHALCGAALYETAGNPAPTERSSIAGPTACAGCVAQAALLGEAARGR